MSLKNVTKTESTKAVIEFAVDAETFEKAVTAVYNKKKANITLPGFRKGKAPRSLIEKMYGKGFLYEDAINDVLPEAYEAALKESGLETVGRPEFDIVSIDENGLVMSANVTLKPEVTIADYKGITLTKKTIRVTEDEIMEEIGKLRERNSRKIDVTDRAAQDGDITVIDFEGFKDGVAFEGGKGEGFELKLGSGQFIPGFEEQVVGHSVGEEFDINVTFPADYHASDLAGAPPSLRSALCPAARGSGGRVDPVPQSSVPSLIQKTRHGRTVAGLLIQISIRYPFPRTVWIIRLSSGFSILVRSLQT